MGVSARGMGVSAGWAWGDLRRCVSIGSAPCRTMAGGGRGSATEPVEHADADGERNERVLRGSEGVVRTRQENARSNSRARAAVQAALDQIDRAKGGKAAVPADALEKERSAAAKSGGIVAKTAGKVATDVHTWNQFVEEQGVEIGEYPTEAQAVTFATWLSMRRERVCLAQREGSTARLTGLVKRTVRNMMTELFAHAWPRQWPAFAALERKERAAYEQSILKQVDSLHTLAARTLSAVSLTCGRTWVREQRALLPAGADDASRRVSQAGGELSEDERARAQQLLAQTAPVTVRKHFYRTEVYQVQDCLLACDEKVMDVNSAVALGGAAAIMQTTGARCGMLTTDSYDADSVIWCTVLLRVLSGAHKQIKWC